MIELMDHQKEALTRSRELTNMALFWEQGTGKTGGMIHILLDKYRIYGTLLRTLIVAPPVVLEQWKEEFAKFSRINPDDILVLNGPYNKRIKALQTTDAKIIITNYEFTQSDDLFKTVQDFRTQILILDESHYCKSGTSIRAKKMFKISKDQQVTHRSTPIRFPHREPSNQVDQ